MKDINIKSRNNYMGVKKDLT